MGVFAAFRRAWRSLRASGEQPEEPLVTLFERVKDEPRRRYRRRQGNLAARERDRLEPHGVEAVEAIAARQAGGLHLARPRRRWAMGAAAAALLCGAGALAAVSWAVWGAEEDEISIELASNGDAEPVRARGSTPKLPLEIDSDDTATLTVSGLRRARAGHQYVIWVRRGGRPQAAGTFRRGKAVRQLTRPVPKGAVVEVTLEPKGRPVTQTGDVLFEATRDS